MPAASILDLGRPVFLDSGTSAISLALRTLDIEPGDVFHVPAYHCPSMFEPAVNLGMDVRFYKIHADLSIDLEAVREQVTPRSKAMLVPHFFGYQQDMKEILSFARASKVTVIEDCAHAFFGDVDSGNRGEYVVGSTRKFFEGPDGGCLITPGRVVDYSLVEKPSVLNEVRAFVDWIEEANLYDGAPMWMRSMVPFLAMKNALRGGGSANTPVSGGNGGVPAAEPAAGDFRIRPMSWIGSRNLRHARLKQIVDIRHRNYALLDDALRDIPGLYPLTTRLPMTTAPYMYPLLIEDPELYVKLMQERIPVWRWDYSDTSCDVAVRYSQHLIQLPCHQGLAVEDIHEIIDTLLTLNASMRAAPEP